MNIRKTLLGLGTVLLIGNFCALTSVAQGWNPLGKSMVEGSAGKSVTSAMRAAGGELLQSSIASNVKSVVAANVGSTAFHPVIPPTIPLTDPMLCRVFQARETTPTPTNLFSGVVFRTTYNGQPETYVAVAAHALSLGEKVLSRRFTADIYVGEGQYQSVPAEIVQVSAPSMLDLAIGKVLEGEEHLVPFDLSGKAFTCGDTATSYGFAGQKLVVVPGREFSSETPFCLRTTMPYPREQRIGLCGSALVDQEGDLLGIHTGSSYGKKEWDDVGHTTNAALLDVLVDAFHHDGESTFPLLLAGRKILDMPVDGYISYIRFYDGKGKQLWQRGFEYKFAYDQVSRQIEQLSPRYIELTIHRVQWENDQLHEIRKRMDKSRRTYRYDMQEGRVVWESKPK